MYTLNEIEQAAKSKARKVTWIWILVFGIPIGIMNCMAISANDFQPIFLILDTFLFISALIMYHVAEAGTKKKMKEENEQEERQERDEHYKRMEELLEKMSKKQ